jgi:hypothetical protein
MVAYLLKAEEQGRNCVSPAVTAKSNTQLIGQSPNILGERGDVCLSFQIVRLWSLKAGCILRPIVACSDGNESLTGSGVFEIDLGADTRS